MNSKRKILIAGGLVAAVAASGGAFTAGLGGLDTDRQLGAGTVSVDGATVSSVDYNYSNDGDSIVLDDVVVTFTNAPADGDVALYLNGGGAIYGTVDGVAETATFDTSAFAVSSVLKVHIVVDDELDTAAA